MIHVNCEVKTQHHHINHINPPEPIQIMTTFIPNLTLPAQVFSTPAISILLPVVLGAAVGYSVSPKQQTPKKYLELKQPPLRPPPWVFGPVWTTLYGLMGYSAYRAWTVGTTSLNPNVAALAKQGATLYTIQLGLNMLWTPLFFGLKRPVEATVDIVALTGIVGYLTYIWSGVDQVAAWALVPYLGWLSFATYLCASIGHLNNWDISDKEIPTAKEI